MINPRPHPPALEHGEIVSVFDDIYMVRGGVRFKYRFIPIKGERNMLIIREAGELTLINTVRLTEPGLEKLEALGQIRHIVRIGGFHGMDDPFYKERYGAHVWSVNAPYNATLNPQPGPDDVYFEADTLLSPGTALPISDAEFIEITSSTPKESVVLLNREGGIVISADCFQNIDPNSPGPILIKFMMRRFLRRHNIGPGWYSAAQPDINEVSAILDREFEHVLPSHGDPVIGNAAAQYRPRVEEIQKVAAR